MENQLIIQIGKVEDIKYTKKKQKSNKMCSCIWVYWLSLQLEINQKYFSSFLRPKFIELQLKAIATIYIMVKLLLCVLLLCISKNMFLLTHMF